MLNKDNTYSLQLKTSRIRFKHAQLFKIDRNIVPRSTMRVYLCYPSASALALVLRNPFIASDHRLGTKQCYS